MGAFDEMMNDPFLAKYFKGLARMLGEYYQTKVPDMTPDELYELADFFPSYDPEKHDYSTKPVGYTCKAEDGTIMTLVDTSISTMDVDGDGTKSSGPAWHCHWSNDPMKAKAYTASIFSPYTEGNCCFWDGKVYRALSNEVAGSPEEDPESWEELQGVTLPE